MISKTFKFDVQLIFTAIVFISVKRLFNVNVSCGLVENVAFCFALPDRFFILLCWEDLMLNKNAKGSLFAMIGDAAMPCD
jgi:hypothetical protein